MSPIVLEYDPITREATFFIDNSSTERIDTCQRSAEYYLSRRKEANRDKPALKFGGILHKILEHRYRHIDKPVSDLKHDLIDIASAEFSKYTPPDGDYRNFATAVDAIEHYSSIYPFEPFDLVELNGVPAVEVPFACPLATVDINSDMMIWDGPTTKVVYVTRIHIMWKGKIDIVLRREGRLYGMDHKSTSMMGPTYFQDFVLSGQVYGYAWALQQLINETPHGFIINGLGVRAPTKTGKKLEFTRFTVVIYPELLAEWYTDTVTKLVDFFEMARRGYFPKQTKWCAGKYGMCEYHNVCTLSPAMRETMLSTNEFKDVTWDPLKAQD